LRAEMFTISRRVGALSAAISVAAATRTAKNLMVCIAFSPLRKGEMQMGNLQVNE
jgi:hypothetical protein